MSTLKINDLSVGDWVRCRGRNGRIECLDAIRDYERIRVAVESYLGTMYQFVGIEDIEPIPITAEILEKIGWRIIEKEALGEDYEYDGDERVWDNDNNKIDICEQKQGEFWHSYRSEYYLYRLYYVHQLQHLMRLYGVEEEIKFKVNLISTT